MTCLVGLEHDGRVWLAGDSYVGGGGFRGVSRMAKVRAASGLVYGAGGSNRECSIAMYWTPPRFTGRGDPTGWLVQEFVPRLWRAITDDGIERDKLDLGLLVGVAGRLYEVDATGGVDSSTGGYMAIGTEVAIAAALGNMAATRRYGPRFRLRSALRAAAAISPEVCPPWVTVSTAAPPRPPPGRLFWTEQP